MVTRLRRRLAGEDGISLVEMLVALVMLAVVLSASAGFFTTTLVSLQGAELRTMATALANEELENLRVLGWDDLGFYADDFTVADPAEPGTVEIEAERPASAAAPLPAGEATRSNTTMRIHRSITWVDNSQTSEPTDYKRLVVTVDWDDRGRGRTITVESLRSPNPNEQEASTFVLSLLDVTPDVVYIHADGQIDVGANPPGGVVLSARTSSPANFVTVRIPQRDGTVSSRELGSVDYLSWSGTVGSPHLRNGDVTLTFIATRSTPYEQQVIGTRLVRFLQPVAVSSLVASPQDVVACPGDTAPAVTLTLLAKGLVEEDRVTVEWSGETYEAVWTGPTVDGSLYALELPAGSYTETTTAQVQAVRLQDGATASAGTTVMVTVQTPEECAA